jgi:hypothetical protein
MQTKDERKFTDYVIRMGSARVLFSLREAQAAKRVVRLETFFFLQVFSSDFPIKITFFVFYLEQTPDPQEHSE